MYQGSQIQAFVCRSGTLATMRSSLHFASKYIYIYIYKFSCPLENPALNNFKQLLLSLFLISALFRASQGVRHATMHWESPKWENYLEIFHRLFFTTK